MTTDPCPNCGHARPHSGGGIGVCLEPGCGCDDTRSFKQDTRSFKQRVRAADMTGVFEGGSDSVEWLRDQRDDSLADLKQEIVLLSADLDRVHDELDRLGAPETRETLCASDRLIMLLGVNSHPFVCTHCDQTFDAAGAFKHVNNEHHNITMLDRINAISDVPPELQSDLIEKPD